MNESQTGADGDPSLNQRQDRLDSWKKIAAYLKREVSTVQRWERREGMPVHRHLHDKLGSVFAYRSELEAWWESRRVRLEPPPAPTHVRPGRPWRPWRPAPWVAAAVAAVGAAVLVYLATLARDSWRDPLAGAGFARLPGFAGSQEAATISRDGNSVAFLSARDGHTDVWAGNLVSASYRNLTHGLLGELSDNPSIRLLGFSPDSSLVSIWVRRADGSRPSDVNVFALPLGGGAPQIYLPEIAEFDWSSDGKRLVYHTTAPGDPIFVREPGASSDRRIYAAPAGVHCHFPLWSPDGAFIYFVRGVPPAGEWDIWRIRPSGAGLERITSHKARVSYPVLLDGRTLLYLATDADGSGPWLYGLDLERRAPHRLGDLESYASLGASADGRRLVATLASHRSSLWRVALTAPDAAGTARPPVLVATDGAAPRLGPDFLVYLSAHGGRPGVWTLSRGTAREVWSGARGSVIGAPAVSRDGRIAFSVTSGAVSQLYLIHRDGSQPRELARGLALRGSPAWAPDGRSVSVAVLREGEPRVTRFPVADEAAQPLLTEYSLDQVWSPDGRFLIYSGADVGTTFPVRAAAADGRPYPMPGLMLTRGARRMAFLDSPRSLVVLGGGIAHRELRLFDLGSGKDRVLVVLPPDFVVSDFDVAADGSEVVLERAQETSELVMIERRR